MLSKALIAHLKELLSTKILHASPLSGGDINEVYLLQTTNHKFVVKLNSASRFPGMFKAEAKGLDELKSSNTFSIPEAIAYGEVDKVSYLLLQYVDSASRASDFWEVFGQQLAAMHQISEEYFGLKKDNYIGSLPQYNTKCQTASAFYIQQRLEPQFQLASKNGYLFSKLDVFYKNIEGIIPQEPSSLIHGDLWSGNFMEDGKGAPCLIDPAVAYSPREMDIAMMHLFGGFDPQLFEVYHEIFPLQKGWKQRISLFQLYYLLVHLNLFGSSYYTSVKRIIESYS
ncbi:fructosamine kinase family protein [Aquimarina spongiae]|uniref:Protein kinase domain-containing protein n=1 Tax=Aquimarina spongiae TaxID=570521 RepID=A0A1M6E3D0_9FLAO|nr:fructosamine kinase family protein [Aquimarina spongiae]SHI79893.1 hypothetical protein SAMN04488508_103184 [Aquimarina spongiae]